MASPEHEQRASKPAPRRYEAEANPLRVAPENTDTPEATVDRLAGELHLGGAKLPSPQSSAAGGLLRRVTPAELDRQLWKFVGEQRA
jgi:hypothetical protein